MILDVPVFNKDGSVKFSATMDEKQVQAILQFGLNFLLSTGLAASYNIDIVDDEQMPLEFDD